ITIGFPADPGTEGTVVRFGGPPGDTKPDGSPVTFNGAVFTDNSRIFTSVAIVSATALPDIDSSRVRVDGAQLLINFMSASVTAGESELVLRVNSPAAPANRSPLANA